tara:strand:- start:1025 stop:1549 length:525 start_codon:yes stop_codon:yes gene_type:complete
MGRRILKENIENTSVKEFLSFMQKVRDERLFQETQWGISDGQATSYKSVGYFIEDLIKQIRKNEGTDSPITNYWISRIGGINRGQEKVDIEKAEEGGLNGILQLGRDYKDKGITISKINTNFTSKDKEEFGKFMGSGDGGSLDESKDTSGISLAALGKELADEMEDELKKKKMK